MGFDTNTTIRRIYRATSAIKLKEAQIAECNSTSDDLMSRLRAAYLGDVPVNVSGQPCSELYRQLVEVCDQKKKLRYDLGRIDEIKLKLIGRLAKTRKKETGQDPMAA